MRFMTDSGEVKCVRFDGYPIGNVDLEGVMFYAWIEDGNVHVDVENESKEFVADNHEIDSLIVKARDVLLGEQEPGGPVMFESVDRDQHHLNGKPAWLMKE